MKGTFSIAGDGTCLVFVDRVKPTFRPDGTVTVTARFRPLHGVVRNVIVDAETFSGRPNAKTKTGQFPKDSNDAFMHYTIPAAGKTIAIPVHPTGSVVYVVATVFAMRRSDGTYGSEDSNFARKRVIK